ncbi:MAG TPA: CoA pyrophosphatase [candidate division Zixibacteria bacterium]|nr:CoA pyrophosphatase [candidate division Zixibacteria bacterium]
MNESNERLKAAVLVPVYRNKSGELILVMVRRTEGDIHGGQLAFPGGKVSAADRTPLDTALREAEEEIGLKKSNVEILEQLPNVFTQTSRFDITPFLAKIVRPEKWIMAEREVAEILEIPVKDLLAPDAYGEEIKRFPQWPEPRKVQFYRVGQYQLWGATYRILSPILKDLTMGKWEI